MNPNTDQIKAIQRALGITADGIAGPVTFNAIYLFLQNIGRIPGIGHVPAQQPIPAPQTPAVPGDRVDERSEGNITTLNARVQPLARQFVRKCAEVGITVKIIDGSRTYAQQDVLFEQGRTKPGEIVTNARGRQSFHTFGVAFDFGVFVNAKYIDDSPAYTTAGHIGQSLGLEWGGAWAGSLVDRPHIQYNPNHLSMAEMRARHDRGIDVLA